MPSTSYLSTQYTFFSFFFIFAKSWIGSLVISRHTTALVDALSLRHLQFSSLNMQIETVIHLLGDKSAILCLNNAFKDWISHKLLMGICLWFECPLPGLFGLNVKWPDSRLSQIQCRQVQTAYFYKFPCAWIASCFPLFIYITAVYLYIWPKLEHVRQQSTDTVFTPSTSPFCPRSFPFYFLWSSFICFCPEI